MAAQQFDLVLAANRLPVARVAEASGGRWQRSPGGLVSAIEPLMRGRDAAWVGWAGEPGPPPPPFRDGGVWLRPVGLSAEQVRQYYDGFSNATLWPLFHDLVVPAVFHRAWWHTYREVNARFAEAVVEVAAPGATVWVQDYHLVLVPRLVRRLRPDLRIGWFDHVPFPPPELFAQLPWRREMLDGLLGADFVGFQQDGDADNFLRSCRRLLAVRTLEDGTVEAPAAGGSCPRRVGLGAVPISVDFTGLDALARNPSAAVEAARFRASLGDPDVLLLGVDRLDYTKGIRHRLKAYEELLRDRRLEPGRVVLVESALLSRERIDSYRLLRDEVEDAVGRINARYSDGGCPAVHLSYKHFPLATMVAMYLAADVMVVTPLRDGMNLVAKEYVACRPDLGGALVLSEFAGAWQELREAFPCNPHDVEDLKEAVMAAATTPARERRRRMETLRRRVADHDVECWAAEFLERVASPTRPAAGRRKPDDRPREAIRRTPPPRPSAPE